MQRFKKMMIVGMMGLAALIFGIQATSHALTLGFNDTVNPILYLSDNQDDQYGKDLNPLVGVITYLGKFGDTNWLINVTTGVSKPILGSEALPEIDLNSVNITSGGAGHLILGVFDSGFTGPISDGVAGAFDFMVGGTTSGTAAFYAKSSETFIGPTFASLGPFGPGAFSGTTSGSFNSGSPFSLGIIADITHLRAGGTSFDANIQVLEPSVLLLLGVGLVGLWGCRKKFKK